MLSYAKLWVLLEKQGMKKTDLKKIISSATIAKLGKNEVISSTVIEKICAFLNCQPGDIMEYISNETIEKMSEELDNTARNMINLFKEKGVSAEEFTRMIIEELPEYIKSLENGENPTTETISEELDKLK